MSDDNSFITQRVELNARYCCNETDTLTATLREANATKNAMTLTSTLSSMSTRDLFFCE